MQEFPSPNTLKSHAKDRAWRLPEYATTLMPGLIIGPVVYWLYRELVGLLLANATPGLRIAYPILVTYVVPAVMLVALLLIHRRLVPGISIAGNIKLKHLAIGSAAVLTTYLVCLAAVLTLGLGREITMILLAVGRTETQQMIMISMLFVFPPIVEEIAFRHFILGSIPYRRNLLWSFLAITGSAIAFMAAHFLAYDLWTTHVAMFTLGVIFAVARIVTGGLLLPMLLHSLAVGTALVLDSLWVRYLV